MHTTDDGGTFLQISIQGGGGRPLGFPGGGVSQDTVYFP